jgi:hypothetical protein
VRAAQEAVVDEEVLVHVEARIAALEVAGQHSRRRDGARSGPARAPVRDRIGLHEAEPRDRALPASSAVPSVRATA